MTQSEADLYEEWKRAGPHLAEYASELVGTAFLVFCVVGVVSFLFGGSSPAPGDIPSAALRLADRGAAAGRRGLARRPLAAGPPERWPHQPGGLAGFWLLGKMHRRDVAGYIGGQLLGAGAGAWLGGLTFGPWAREVHDATLRPKVSAGEAFLLEMAATFLLTSVVYAFVSHKRLMRWTPGAAMLMSGVLVGLDGNLSGAGMNPARWFGPACAVDYWRNIAVYVARPDPGRAAGRLPAPLGAVRALHAAHRQALPRHPLPLPLQARRRAVHPPADASPLAPSMGGQETPPSWRASGEPEG